MQPNRLGGFALPAGMFLGVEAVTQPTHHCWKSYNADSFTYKHYDTSSIPQSTAENIHTCQSNKESYLWAGGAARRVIRHEREIKHLIRGRSDTTNCSDWAS